MKVLAFSEYDLPITKGLRRLGDVVTAWPAGKDGADLLYDPEKADLWGLMARLGRGFKPDWILLTNLDYITFVWSLHELEVPVVATITDSNLCMDAFRQAIPLVDLFICNEERQVECFKALGAEAAYLPWFGVDSDIFRPNREEPRWDVVFVGNLNPSIHKRRGKFLERLLSVPERFNMRVLTGVHGRDYARALARGRIVFNHAIRGEVNRRVYEALGVGRLLLVEETNNEVLRYFQDRRHLVTYNEENLLDVVEYYLCHADARESIARAGHEEAFANHTGQKKAEALWAIIEPFLRKWKPSESSHELDLLHRSAARIYLHHGRLVRALHHSQEALQLKDDIENRVQRARVLGWAAYCLGERDPKLLNEFSRATERALELCPRGAFLRWNRVELQHFLGKGDPGEVRSFIDDLLRGHIELECLGGPLLVTYDAFRIAWQGTLSQDFQCPEDKVAAQRKILLSRAYEVLGDEESRRERLFLAYEAYSESLLNRKDGYILHKVGILERKLGRTEQAVRSLREAIAEAPFFFAARRDLAAMELNEGRLSRGHKEATEAMLLLSPTFGRFTAEFREILEHTTLPEELEPYELRKPLLWDGHFFNTSGYARDTSLLVDELLRRGIPVSVSAWEFPGLSAAMDPRMRCRLEEAGRKAPIGDFVHIVHFFPDTLEKRKGACARVCRCMFETDRLPENWIESLKQYDQVWVPSEFTRQMYLREGIPAEALAVIPSAVGQYPLGRPEPLEILDRRAFNFLSVFEWNPRKGWEILSRAFLSEFTRADDVALILRVYSILGKTQVEIRDEMRAFIRKDLGLDPDQTPEILFVDETLSHGEMQSLYAQAQAFVLPSRGEAFGRPYLEALIAGLPTIGTRWGGQLDFLTEETGYLIDIEGLERVPDHVAIYGGHRWALPSVDHLRKLLRHVYEDPEEGRTKARRAMGDLLKRYNVQHVANLAIKELNRLEGH